MIFKLSSTTILARRVPCFGGSLCFHSAQVGFLYGYLITILYFRAASSLSDITVMAEAFSTAVRTSAPVTQRPLVEPCLDANGGVCFRDASIGAEEGRIVARMSGHASALHFLISGGSFKLVRAFELNKLIHFARLIN